MSCARWLDARRRTAIFSLLAEPDDPVGTSSIDDDRINPAGRSGPRQIVVASAQANLGASGHVGKDLIGVTRDREGTTTATEDYLFIAPGDDDIPSSTVADELTAAVGKHDGVSNRDCCGNGKANENQ